MTTHEIVAGPEQGMPESLPLPPAPTTLLEALAYNATAVLNELAKRGVRWAAVEYEDAGQTIGRVTTSPAIDPMDGYVVAYELPAVVDNGDETFKWNVMDGKPVTYQIPSEGTPPWNADAVATVIPLRSAMRRLCKVGVRLHHTHSDSDGDGTLTFDAVAMNVALECRDHLIRTSLSEYELAGKPPAATPSEHPDFLVSGRQQILNDAGADLRRSIALLQRASCQLEAARVGALVAGVFGTHPWLESVTVEFTPSDGLGRLPFDARVVRVAAREGTAPTRHDGSLFEEQGDAPSASQLADYLWELLRNEWTDIGFALGCNEAFEPQFFEMSRGQVEHLMGGKAGTSGRQCFIALFPGRALMLGMLGNDRTNDTHF